VTTLYVASPLGFSESGRAFHDGRLLPLIRDSGYDVLDPWALSAAKVAAVHALSDIGKRRDAWLALSAEIGATNRTAIDRCDGLVAVLDGSDVDSGTAAEIGYAFARGKRVLGYRGDARSAGDNDAVVVNLQVDYFIRASGGDIVREVSAIPAALRRLFG
jgi:nucleoside 2-deoxyribosyltransferase